MRQSRNLIAFNHMPKTAGLAIVNLLKTTHQDSFVPLFEFDPVQLNYKPKILEAGIKKIELSGNNILYTSFHPESLFGQNKLINILRKRSICFSVIRKPSEVFESTVRYFHDRSIQNPKYFEQYLKREHILQIRNPNTIFDLCLDIQNKKEGNRNLYLCQYRKCLQNYLPTSLTICSHQLSALFDRVSHPTYEEFFKTAQADYFALCTFEHLQLLIDFFKHNVLVTSSVKLPRMNTSLNNESIFLTKDRREKLDLELCSIDYKMWLFLSQNGPLFNEDLVNRQKLLEPNITYF
jgi:hypothetical protein